MAEQTVRLHVEVDIQYVDNDYDTEMTVEQWNALTPDERQAIKKAAWESAAESDNGGIWPVTPGAAGE